ncbi:30S ribosomal protein S17 [bacterium]|jgi:small subunit ribosomal protein S17|nr:30S ribosomal protein S17 [bacterium]
MRERRRALVGTVTSNKMQKTIVVQVERVARHPLYGKVVKSHKKYKVHDENNDANIGDTVQIRECRPMSKDKQFYLEKILTRAEIV